MKIIVVGAGMVGSAICTELAEEGHDITVVDVDETLLNELSNTTEVMTVLGNGADLSVLRRAGVEHANLVIAVTQGDEINILCCTAARKLGARHTIARVRNPEYNELMQLMRSEMNLSLTINPELSVAKEIYRMLRFPAATKIDVLCRGRVELAELVLSPSSPLVGLTLNEVRSRSKISFLVCGVLRRGVTHIPTGDFRLAAGDVLCVTASEQHIAAFFREFGMHRNPVKNVLIAGSGRITYYLEELLREGHIASVVIDKSQAECLALAEDFKCTLICDDPTKQEALLAAGLTHTDAFLALSEVDEENAIVSLYAKTQGVPKVVTLIRKISYIDLFKSAGLESVVSPKSSTAAQILRYVRSHAHVQDSKIESLHKLMDGSVEALEFLVQEEVEGLTGVPLRELRSVDNMLIACIVHEGEIIIPSGADMISRGDTVVIITKSGTHMDSIGDILR